MNPNPQSGSRTARSTIKDPQSDGKDLATERATVGSTTNPLIHDFSSPFPSESKIAKKINKEIDLNERRNIRFRNFDYSQKLSQAVKDQINNSAAKVDVEVVSSKYKETENIIKGNLSEQESKIQEKLEERRRNSIIKSRSQSKNKNEGGDLPQSSNPSQNSSIVAPHSFFPSGHQRRASGVGSNKGSSRNIDLMNILGALEHQKKEQLNLDLPKPPSTTTQTSAKKQ